MYFIIHARRRQRKIIMVTCSYIVPNNVFVLQIMVLLQCAGCSAWKNTED